MSIGAGMPGFRRYIYALALMAALILSCVALLSGAQGARASAPSPGATATPWVKSPASATPTPVEVCPYAWYLVGCPQSNYRMLSGVTAISSSDVWAVGQALDTGWWHPVAVHWDGNAWSDVPVPVETGTWSFLSGLATVSANDVWAVGSAQVPGSQSHTLIEHWDGTAWSTVPSPNVPGSSNSLQGVAAVAANDIWAVGTTSTSTPTAASRPLIEHWDGSAWSIAPGATLSNNGALFAIAALSADQVWAVGLQTSDFATTQTLIQRWDGTAWTVIPSPNVGGTGRLNGIALISPSDIWAVGDYQQNYNLNFTLTEHWDGTSWSVVPSPTFSDDYLNAVAAVSTNDVWAVGHSGDGPNTLTLHWDGSTWTRTPSPQPVGPYAHEVASVAALSTGDIWAVGYYANIGSTQQALVMHYTDSFIDVHSTDYFYDAVRWLYCKGAISGYLDGTFRPSNNTTRAQLAKIIVSAESWPYYPPPQTPTFSDVPASSPWFYFVETLNARGVISGYADHTYRPANDVTRSQLCKIVVLAQQWPIDTTGGPHFRDVGTADPFYGFVETAYNRGIISGYDCGPGCLEFRPGFPATRGQISKIVFGALVQPGLLTGKK